MRKAYQGKRRGQGYSTQWMKAILQVGHEGFSVNPVEIRHRGGLHLDAQGHQSCNASKMQHDRY